MDESGCTWPSASLRGGLPRECRYLACRWRPLLVPSTYAVDIRGSPRTYFGHAPFLVTVAAKQDGRCGILSLSSTRRRASFSYVPFAPMVVARQAGCCSEWPLLCALRKALIVFAAESLTHTSYVRPTPHCLVEDDLDRCRLRPFIRLKFCISCCALCVSTSPRRTLSLCYLLAPHTSGGRFSFLDSMCPAECREKSYKIVGA
mmetsp:Transcript_10717/g.33018  ORF Transcript_10717/g.33018 Transcript_10717/m.33018 type:complete len:203 (-) Transcript_10717:297-905(-)